MKFKSLFVLAASSISFLASCSCSNNDQQFLNQINETLKENDKIVTCDDAVKTLVAKDINIFAYEFGNKSREFAYDFDAKQFVIMENNSIVCRPNDYTQNPNSFSYFKFTSVYEGNSIYSQYLLDDFHETENLVVTTGLDVGSHKDIKNVTYAGSVGAERNINIRVYCDYLTIYADSDNVSYYGNANNIFVGDVKTFNIYGKNSYVQLRKGEVTFKKDSETDFLEIPTDYIDSVKVKQDDGAKVFCAINAPEIKAQSLIPVEVSTFEQLNNIITTDNAKFIRLTAAFDLTSSLNITDGKTFIIDLNGFAITVTEGGISIAAGCSLYLLDTEYSYNENCGIFLQNYNYIIVEGYLLMNGGNIFSSSASCVILLYGTGAFDMYGGQIIVDNGNYAITIMDSGNCNIHYGTFISSGDGIFKAYGNLNIEAGNFISSTCICNALLLSGGKITISGGTFTSKNCIYVDTYSIKANDIKIDILGGSFISDDTSLSDQTNSVIYIDKMPSPTKCTINIDDAYLYSRCGYIAKVCSHNLSNEDGSIIINCNSGIYDYYLGDGTYVDEDIADSVTIKKGGTWINHPYA